MYNGYKIIDADSHTMEPDSLWDKYLEPEYRPWAPGGSQSKITLQNLTTKGFSIGNDGKPGAPYIHDGEGGLLTYAEAFKPYLDRNFDAKSFLTYMDITGIDLLVLYPTQCLGLTAQIRGEGRQMQSPKIADALSRAYNNWVYDFSNEGEGRLFGAGYIDLRDAGMAAKEVRRCVKELGLKALYYMPQPVSGIPLHHPYYDEVWAEIADSGVPLGIHFTQGSARIGQEYWGDWSLGRAATAFPFEEMMTCVSLTGGGVLERHPNMKVVFLESGAGWAPYWLWWCDDKWHQASIVRSPDTTEPPSFYFKRQCYMSGEPDEPGFSYCVQAGLEDNICTATDFPHPEDVHFPRVLDEFFSEQSKLLTEEQIRKVLWDNPARLYNIT
jgi:predicted TIM-barrel fold metal-dependent hydrolase